MSELWMRAFFHKGAKSNASKVAMLFVSSVDACESFDNMHFPNKTNNYLRSQFAYRSFHIFFHKITVLLETIN